MINYRVRESGNIDTRIAFNYLIFKFDHVTVKRGMREKREMMRGI